MATVEVGSEKVKSMNMALDMGLSGSANRALKVLEEQMAKATTFAEWLPLALEHDENSGQAQWRSTEQTSLYDYSSIRTRINTLRQLRKDDDDYGLLFALNEGIHGNMGGMGKPRLYARAKAGTKQLIEAYIEEISDSLRHLAQLDDSVIPWEERLEFFRRASHCYGRSALMLSGGGALGNFHLGVVKILIEEGILPVVVSGASAGAFVSAIIATHTDQEYLDMYNSGELLESVSQGAGKFKFSLLNRELTGIEEVVEGIARVVPDMTFAEAYEKTGRSINISVSPAEPQQTSRLLNHIASPNVLIRSAVMASCAIPGVFPAVTLMAKNVNGEEQPYLPSRKWVDGSFSQDLPAKRLARMYGVNHFIVSQVNPAVLPLLSDPQTSKGFSNGIKNISRTLTKQWMRSSLGFTRKHLKLNPKINMALDTVHKLIDQEYTGDINIFPGFRYLNPQKIISASSIEDVSFFIDEGVKATLPKIPSITSNTLIGRTLDAILLDYEHDSAHWLHTGPKTGSR